MTDVRKNFRIALSASAISMLLLASCTKHESTPQQSDSVLSKPIVKQETAPAIIDSGNGLIIDAAHMRTPEHQKLIARFEPVDVVHIYHDYRPLRKDGTPAAEVKKFEKEHKITHEELLAILEEGDLLGWSKAK